MAHVATLKADDGTISLHFTNCDNLIRMQRALQAPTNSYIRVEDKSRVTSIASHTFVDKWYVNCQFFGFFMDPDKQRSFKVREDRFACPSFCPFFPSRLIYTNSMNRSKTYISELDELLKKD